MRASENGHTTPARAAVKAVDKAQKAIRSELAHFREEIANCITHGAGLVLSLVGFGFLLHLAITGGTPPVVVGAIVFGATLILMYAASTVYHIVRSDHLTRLFRVIDHISVYFLIAGPYTPIRLLVSPAPLRWQMLLLVWAIALTGTLFKLFFTGRFDRLSLLFYVAMGWLVVLGMGPLLDATPQSALWWLVAGGLMYTGGVVFYAWERLPYNHAIWHVFVLVGSICHFLAVSFYMDAV